MQTLKAFNTSDQEEPLLFNDLRKNIKNSHHWKLFVMLTFFLHVGSRFRPVIDFSFKKI